MTEAWVTAFSKQFEDYFDIDEHLIGPIYTFNGIIDEDQYTYVNDNSEKMIEALKNKFNESYNVNIRENTIKTQKSWCCGTKYVYIIKFNIVRKDNEENNI